MNTINIILPKPYAKQKEIIDDSSRFKVICAGRRVGKSTLCKIITILHLLEGKRVCYITPEFGYAEQIYEEILQFFSDELITRFNKSRLKFNTVTNGEMYFFSGEALHRTRGREFDLLIVDEAAHIPDLEPEWNLSLRPLLMKTKGKAIFISTPNGRNFFYSLFQKGINSEDGYKSWQFSSHFNPYLPKDELEELTRTMPEANYRQEIMAEPSENTNNPFGTQYIIANTIQQLSQKEPVILAADLARTMDWTAIIGLDEDGMMCYFDRFKMPWELTLNKLKEVRNKFPIPQIVLDSTGVGSVILERAQQEIYNVYGFQFTSESKPKIIHSLIKAIETGSIKVNEETAREMHTFIYKYTASGHLQYMAASGYHDDCIMALAMANHFKKQYNMDHTIHIF